MYSRLIRMTCIVALASTGGSALPVNASETISYSYDANGRLVAAVTSGTVNNGRAVTYCHDKAGSRKTLTSDTSGSATACVTPCRLAVQTPYFVSDDSELIVRTERNGSVCDRNISLSYSIQRLSGTFEHSGANTGGFVLTPPQYYGDLSIYPIYGSIPNGQTSVLQVTITSSTPEVTISPNVSMVTIYGVSP